MCSSVAFGTVTWPCSCHHRPPSPGRLHLPKGKLSRIEHTPPPAMPHRPDFMWVGLGRAWGPDNNPPTPGKALFLRSALPTPRPFHLVFGLPRGWPGAWRHLQMCSNHPVRQFRVHSPELPKRPGQQWAGGAANATCHRPPTPLCAEGGAAQRDPRPPTAQTKNPESSAGSWPWMSENAGTGAFGGASAGGGVARRSPRGPSVGCA